MPPNPGRVTVSMSVVRWFFLVSLFVAAACASPGPTPSSTSPHGTREHVLSPPLPIVEATAAMTRGVRAQPPPIELRCEIDSSCPQAVAIVVFPRSQTLERCTGTLIDADRILTASHCLPPTSRRAGARCDEGWVGFAGARGTEWHGCARIEQALGIGEQSVLRRDYAILRLADATSRTPVVVDRRPVTPGSIVTVASITPHPIYDTQHELAARLCRVTDGGDAHRALGPNAANVGWLSDCPIEWGNSGSPVLDYDGRLRAIVHGGSEPFFGIGVTTPPPGG